jgi:hypothetical protein
MRLHDRGDGLRWLRNKQCSCRCDCKRTRPQKSVHLQLLAHADGRFRVALTPGSAALVPSDGTPSPSSLISINRCARRRPRSG